jgi:hypothetical protein
MKLLSQKQEIWKTNYLMMKYASHRIVKAFRLEECPLDDGPQHYKHRKVLKGQIEVLKDMIIPYKQQKILN